MIVFGHKRQPYRGAEPLTSSCWAPEGFIYHIPPGNGPEVFEKVEPTEPELQRMLATSPLRSHLTAPAQAALPSPPLALGIGHVALLLASGHLDGVVQPEGKPPHVVRGTSRKRAYVADVTETENDDGSTTTVTTIAERSSWWSGRWISPARSARFMNPTPRTNKPTPLAVGRSVASPFIGGTTMQQVPDVGSFDFEVYSAGRHGRRPVVTLPGPLRCHRASRERDSAAVRRGPRDERQGTDRRLAVVRQGSEADRVLASTSVTSTAPA